MNKQAKLNEISEKGKKEESKRTILGEIPENWDSELVENLFNLENGSARENRTSSRNTYETQGDFDVYGANGKIGKYEDTNLEKGLVIGRVGSVGSIYEIEEPAWVSDNAIKAKLDSNNNLRFLYYVMKRGKLGSLANQTTHPLLNQGIVGSVRLPLPSLSEQRRIVSILYNVDQAIQKTEEIIEQTQRVKKGLMQNLFTEGYYDHEEFEDKSRFGEIPAKWEIRKLNQISDVIGGSTPDTKEEEYWGGDIPWVTPSELTNLDSNTLKITERYITEDGLNSSSAQLLPSNSLLLTSRASIGMCAINGVEMATNQGFQSLVPNEEIDVCFLMYRMHFESPYLNSLGSGSTFSEISNSMMKKVEIPVPTEEEQRKISETLKAVDNQIFSLKKEKDRLQLLKRGLMQDLLTGEVRTKDKSIEVLDEVLEVENNN